MPLSIAQFFERLRASGVLAPAEVEALYKKIPADKRGQAAEKIVPKLVEAKKLTQHQAEAILEGHHDSLVLGDYVVLSKIGAGGMGQVYKARHRRMKRMVALKVLPPNITDKGEAVRRFAREVEAAAKLSHPNIVAAHDASEQKGIHYLVMELVEGDDLLHVVKKRGVLPPDVAVGYIVQAARGLAHAHAQGIVHRDIKPANLLLDSFGTVKILDMGLARFEHGREEKSEGLTQSGTLMGTIDYMSPEQALDTKNADARADIYSLGCTLFYLLTGKRLYEAENMMKRLVAHRDAPIPSLDAERPDLPPGLNEVFARMVAKKTADRFQSMEEVSEALLALRGAAVPIATPVAMGDLTVGGVASGGTVASGFSLPPPPPPAPPPLPASNTIGTQYEIHTQHTFTPAFLAEPTPKSKSSLPAPLLIAAGLALAGVALLVVVLVLSNGFSSGKGENELPGEKVTVKNSSGDGAKTGTTSAANTEPIKTPKTKAGETSTGAPTGGVDPSASGASSTLSSTSAGSLRLLPIESLSIPCGGSDVITVAVERIDCAGEVDVRASGLPLGVTASGLTLYSAQDKSEMRFAVAGDAPPADYDITVSATLGKLIATSSFRLSIGASTALRLFPFAAQTVKAGETVSVPVRVRRDSVAGPIQVRIEGLPSELSVKGGGETLLPGASQGDLSITANATAPGKVHTLLVRASSGSVSSISWLRLTVEATVADPGGRLKRGGPGGGLAGGGIGRGSLVGGGVGGMAKLPTSPIAFEHDPVKKGLVEHDLENSRNYYQDGNYVVELRAGKQMYAAAALVETIGDFDAEFKCRLTGSTNGIRYNVGFRDEPPRGNLNSRLSWWINGSEQSCLVRSTWTNPRPGEVGAAMTEKKIFEYTRFPSIKADAFNKLRVRARGSSIELFVNNSRIYRGAVGTATYKVGIAPITFWLVKDREDETGRLEFSEIKITQL